MVTRLDKTLRENKVIEIKPEELDTSRDGKVVKIFDTRGISCCLTHYNERYFAKRLLAEFITSKDITTSMLDTVDAIKSYGDLTIYKVVDAKGNEWFSFCFFNLKK